MVNNNTEEEIMIDSKISLITEGWYSKILFWRKTSPVLCLLNLRLIWYSKHLWFESVDKEWSVKALFTIINRWSPCGIKCIRRKASEIRTAVITKLLLYIRSHWKFLIEFLEILLKSTFIDYFLELLFIASV